MRELSPCVALPLCVLTGGRHCCCCFLRLLLLCQQRRVRLSPVLSLTRQEVAFSRHSGRSQIACKPCYYCTVFSIEIVPGIFFFGKKNTTASIWSQDPEEELKLQGLAFTKKSAIDTGESRLGTVPTKRAGLASPRKPPPLRIAREHGTGARAGATTAAVESAPFPSFLLIYVGLEEPRGPRSTKVRTIDHQPSHFFYTCFKFSIIFSQLSTFISKI